MRSNIRKSWRRLRRESARKFLYETANDHISKYPQLVTFGFDLIAVEIMLDGRYDNAQLLFLETFLASKLADKTVLDVGANIGNHAIAFAGIASKVIAFEPHPQTFQLLRLNTMGFANIDIIEKGISDQRGALPAISPSANFGASSITGRPPGAGEFAWTCNVDRLDDVYDDQWGAIGMIKIDVEGHEANVIRGAEKILRQNEPIVLFEQHRGVIEKGTSESVELLRALGYSHLYALELESTWSTPQALPSPVRKLGRLLEGAIKGAPDEKVTLSRVDRLEDRTYSNLIASVYALST